MASDKQNWYSKPENKEKELRLSNKLQAALALATKGFKVFPVTAGKKSPPLIKGWPEKATTDPETIKGWWLDGDHNPAIHCEGMVVIDVDPRKGGNESLIQLEKEHGKLPDTLVTLTPTGGRHLFYSLMGAGQSVANGVDVLGRGLDVRSGQGYVVAPGSTVPAGRYRFAREHAVADAPGWLVGRCRAAPVAAKQPAESVPDADQTVVERAIEFLRTAERSIRGEGGDQTAYRVACGLRDLGVSEQQCGELMRSEAWDHGCGWRDGWLEAKPIRSAYRYAQNAPGTVLAAPTEFPVHESEQFTEREQRGKANLLRLSEFASQQSSRPGYLIKGLLYRRSYASLFGAPGEGKTFVALDISYHVAASLDWQGKRVRGGMVVYLPYEGRGGLAGRVLALRQRYGDKDVPFYIADAAFNLRTTEGRKALGGLLAGLPEKPVLIVIDTFAHALMGGDENSAQDVGAFNSGVAALIEHTGACVMIVHHTGKNKAAGARGSSALLGAIDTELMVDGGAVTASKQRDVEAGEPIGFTLKKVTVGLDEDNEEITSCVVEPSAVASKTSGKVTGNQKRAFDALCELRPTNNPITEIEWKEKCREFLGAKSVAQRFYDLKVALLRKGYIQIDDDGLVTRRCE